MILHRQKNDLGHSMVYNPVILLISDPENVARYQWVIET